MSGKNPGVRAMSKLLDHIDDIAAVILMVSCLLLIGFGIDGEVKSLLAIATGWLFGEKFVSKYRKGR
jgi:hypothetical protein